MQIVILEKEQVSINTKPLEKAELSKDAIKAIAGTEERWERYRTGEVIWLEPRATIQIYCAALGVTLEELMKLPIETIFTVRPLLPKRMEDNKTEDN